MLPRKPIRRVDVIYPTSLLQQQFCAWLRDGCGRDLVRGKTLMVDMRHLRTAARLGRIASLTALLGACSGMSLTSPTPSGPAETGMAPEMPATIRPDEIVGKWGLASYQNPADRARTEAQAKAQCKQPY